MQDAAGGSTLAYRQAHELCRGLLSRISTKDVDRHILHRLQRLYFMSGALRVLMGDANHHGSIQDYVSAVELSLQGNASPSGFGLRLSFRDLMVGTCFVGLLICDDPTLATTDAVFRDLSTPE